MKYICESCHSECEAYYDHHVDHGSGPISKCCDVYAIPVKIEYCSVCDTPDRYDRMSHVISLHKEMYQYFKNHLNKKDSDILCSDCLGNAMVEVHVR